MTQVWPANDVMRKILKHPSNNVGFREDGPSEWPDDSFTHRRLEDGDVVLNDPTPKPEPVSVDEPIVKQPKASK